MSQRNCAFCDIISGKLEASLVYENETVIAVMDRRQAHPGHVLIIPKEHFPDIYSLSGEAGSAIMQSLIQVSQAVRDAFKPEGLSIWQSNGVGANQEVPHVHFHVHPREVDDGLLRVYSDKPEYPTMKALTHYAQRIKNCL